MEKSQEQIRFSEIISKHLSGQTLSLSEKQELSGIAKKNEFITERNEVTINGETKITECYWICRGSNWSCNPQSPPPGCVCYKVCI